MQRVSVIKVNINEKELPAQVGKVNVQLKKKKDAVNSGSEKKNKTIKKCKNQDAMQCRLTVNNKN